MKGCLRYRRSDITETVFKAQIEKIAAGGAGLARLEGKSIFIEGSVPGETVLCRITEEHPSWSRAELLEIIEDSPDRVQPVCDFYGICGGCNLQHLSYTAQLAAKTVIIKDTFIHIGGFCPPEPLVFPSKPWGYRNRMQLHCIRQLHCIQQLPGQSWGLKAKKSNEIIPISGCPIADPGIQSLLRGTENQTQVPLPPPEKDRFTVYARDGLLLREGGIQRGKTRILDRELALDAGVFFQSNGTMLERLVMDLREIAAGLNSAGQSLPVADLYCGVGTFSVFLGEFFPHIDLVEENKFSLALARENLMPLIAAGTSTGFFAQRCENWVKNRRRYGFIVADPPRQGLNPALTYWLKANGPPLLAYVSCNPATLARDSKILLAGGYKLTELRLYDFYPQTAHIESLAVFTRSYAP